MNKKPLKIFILIAEIIIAGFILTLTLDLINYCSTDGIIILLPLLLIDMAFGMLLIFYMLI